MIVFSARCEELVEAVTAFAGTAPKSLTALLADARTLSDEIDRTDPLRVLNEALDSGPLTAAGVRKVLAAKAAQDTNGEFKDRVTRIVADRFRSALLGGAADEILELMRPAFDEAARAVQDLPFGTNTSAESVLMLGGEAAEAWRTAGERVAVLDRAAGIIELMVRSFEIPAKAANSTHIRLVVACTLTSPSSATTLGDLALFSRDVAKNPAGRWHALASRNKLQLTPIAEAREMYERLRPGNLASWVEAPFRRSGWDGTIVDDEKNLGAPSVVVSA